MNAVKDLEVIFLALEEGETLRDIGDSWSQDDIDDWGIEFGQLLELRNFVLEQDFAVHLGFTRLVDAFFDEECQALLTEEELRIWKSVDLNLAFENFAIAMSGLIAGDLEAVKELVVKDFILMETDGTLASKEIEKKVLANFKDWKSSGAPRELVNELPKLAIVELNKLQELRK